MPGDTLFGEATSALQGASQTASASADRAMVPQSEGVKAGEAASAQLGEDRRQQAGAIDAQKLAQMKSKLDQAENMVTVTPQIALGLVKNTGDKEWLKAVGQPMRADVLMSMYTHGIKVDQAKKAPHITQLYDDDGKVRHAVVYTDEDGNVQQLPLDPGMSAEKLNKGKGGKGKAGGAGQDEDFKKNKEFLAQYNKRRSEYSDPIKAQEVQKSNPEKYDQDTQWLKDNQDQYDKLTRSMGKAGGGGSSSSGAGGGASSDNAPFDADAFIKDALGSK